MVVVEVPRDTSNKIKKITKTICSHTVHELHEQFVRLRLVSIKFVWNLATVNHVYANLKNQMFLVQNEFTCQMR